MTQPKYHILKEYANGVMDQKGKFYPYNWAGATSSTTILSAKENTKFFIKSIILSRSKAESIAAGSVAITISYVSKASCWFEFNTPLMIATTQVGASSEIIPVGLLTDFVSSIAVTITNDTARVHLIYAIIDESPGEYTG